MLLNDEEQAKITAIARGHVARGSHTTFRGVRNIKLIALILKLPCPNIEELQRIHSDEIYFEVYRQSHPKLKEAYQFFFEKYNFFETMQLARNNPPEERQEKYHIHNLISNRNRKEKRSLKKGMEMPQDKKCKLTVPLTSVDDTKKEKQSHEIFFESNLYLTSFAFFKPSPSLSPIQLTGDADDDFSLALSADMSTTTPTWESSERTLDNDVPSPSSNIFKLSDSGAAMLLTEKDCVEDTNELFQIVYKISR